MCTILVPETSQNKIVPINTFCRSKQHALVEQMHNENLEISRVKYSPELADLFNNLKVYQVKLTNIKKNIKSLHERSGKLKVPTA